MSRSITPAPSGSLSPDFITVPSTTGFSAGDYVYQKNGDFGVPPASSPANFNVTQTTPVFGSTVGGIATPVLYTSATTDAGASYGSCAAKLTNGNIVLGYRIGGGASIAFKIVDTNNVTVVAQTIVSSLAVTNPSHIGVTALTGGGFVIHFIGTAGTKPAFGVYTNAGVVTTAVALDATYPTTALTANNVYACALPNGGFALAVQGNLAPNTYLRAFDATGVGAYGWVTVAASGGGVEQTGLAARSDSSVCIAFLSTATTYFYAVYNSGGGSIATGTISTSNSPQQCSVACLTNDTFVIGVLNDIGTLFPRFYLLPTGNVLSSAFIVPVTNVPTAGSNISAASFSMQIRALSSGGFVYFFGDVNGVPYYVFYSAAGVAAYSIPKVLPGPVFQARPTGLMGIVELTGYLSLYYSLPGSSAGNEMFNSEIDLTTYLPYSAVTTASPVGSTSAASGAYARSTSLPMKAAYLAANTETLSLNATVSTGSSYTVAPAAISASPVDSIKSATLPDGRFVIAYKDASTQAVSFNVYSITGVLQTTVAVGTAGSTAAGKVRISALPNGKVVVAYLTATTVVTVAIYSSSFAFITSIIAINPTDSNGYFDVAGLSTNRVAVVFQNSSQTVQYNVYSDALVAISGVNNILAVTSVSELNVVATINGGFWVKFTNSGTSANVHYYYFTYNSVNSYTAFISNASVGTTLNTAAICALAVSPNNFAIGFSSTAAGLNAEFASFTPNNGASQFGFVTVSGFSTNTMSNTSNVALGVTGMGTFVCFAEGNAAFNLVGFTGLQSIASVANSTPTGLLSGITKSTAYRMQACITPSYGYNAVIAWINSANVGQFAIVNAYAFGATQDVTAGVTGSAPTTPLNISQSSGYYLAGVAVSDCPAGGTGQIQTNGVANLNSQYSASTAFQGFDFQNPVTVGVKGTAVGRTVTMIKD